jgi:AcrR family transcriptional regulator
MKTRVVKNADDRRVELLDVALRLFLTKGYERVAVQDITDAVQVAKGTFYHYFASKADLLAQVAERQVGALLAAAECLLDDAPGDAAARFRAVVTMMWGWKRDNLEFAETYSRVLYADENQALRLKFQGSLEAMQPLLAGIVAQGKAEGSFAVADPAWASRATMWLWDGLREWMMPRLLGEGEPEALVDELLAASHAAELACERILGAREGSLLVIEYEGLREWLLELVAALREPAGRRHEPSATATTERM